MTNVTSSITGSTISGTTSTGSTMSGTTNSTPKNTISKNTITRVTTPEPEALKSYANIFEQVVAWNDMDAFNHVNNVVYYRYVESARIDYLSRLDIFRDDITMVLAQSSCTYLKPVTFPDTLIIGTRIKKIGNTSMVMYYCYFSIAQQQVVATAEAVIVRLNKDATDKVPWSDSERDKIIACEQAVGYTPER